MPQADGTSRPRLTKEQKDNIANNLRKLRMAKFPQNDGQKRCSTDMGVDPYQYVQWEEGVRTPYGKNISRIANYFSITVEQLFATPTTTASLGDKEHSSAAPHKAVVARKIKKSRLAPRAAKQTEDTSSPTKRSVKTMNLTLPAELVNVKTVRVTYEGDISVVGVAFLDKQSNLG